MPMHHAAPTAAVIAGVIGAVGLLVAIAAGFLWFCKSNCKALMNKNSDSSSSGPSVPAECYKPGHPGFGPAKQFTMEELEHATKQFNQSNLIGHGSFGQVFKGLLYDTFVAIKRRYGEPQEDFTVEVMGLSEIRHRNLVTLLGSCQESGVQMLVFEYLPNGSMHDHLFGLDTSTKLEFKQRLSIALGAAKGLSHLHSLSPPQLHKNFKTANVLVDESFVVKVADAGVSQLVRGAEGAGPSHVSHSNAFQDPEVGASKAFTEAGDTFSFGVFLLELISGQEASRSDLESNETLTKWVSSRLNSNNLVDHRLNGSYTTDGIRDIIRVALQCVSFPAARRPKMEVVVVELDRILEKEMTLTTVMGEGTTKFIKGSELFTSA